MSGLASLYGTLPGSLLGGVLIGAAALAAMALLGRIAGVSGILGGVADGARGDRAWRLAFVLGLPVGAWLLSQAAGGLRLEIAGSPPLLIAAGLALSGMLDPQKVIGFLDVAGAWDPALAFVMGGALLVTTPGYQWLRRRGGGAALGGPLRWPTATQIDGRLVFGAVLFGVGWGLVGLCPGPALAGWIFTGRDGVIVVTAMIFGNFAWGAWASRGTT